MPYAGRAPDDDDDDVAEDDESLEHTYLTFAVAEARYAVPVEHVAEIVRLQRIFAVPDVAEHIRGVINLRGKVIPLLDVRIRFGLPHGTYTDRTVIVVIRTADGPTGLVVDSVFDIVELPPGSIEPARLVARDAGTPLVTGIGRRDDGVILLVDVAALVAATPRVSPRMPTTAIVP